MFCSKFRQKKEEIETPHKKKMEPLNEKSWKKKKKKLFKLKKNDPSIRLISIHDNGDTICIGQEIQCLPYAGLYFGLISINF